MKTRICFAVLSLVVALGALVSRADADYIYTFDGLNVGGIVDQDNWTASFSGHNASVMAGGAGKYLQSSDSSAFGQVSRLNDANWSFPAFTGTETAATLMMDVVIPDGTTSSSIFALGYDVNNSEVLEFTGTAGLREIGPMFGSSNGTKYRLRGAGAGESAYANFLSGDDAGDWVQLKLEMDFTANGGNGAGTLSVRNLTDGAVSFTTILSDVNLELLRLRSTANGGTNGASDITPSQFNGVFVWVAGSGFGSQTDNLRIVPEPSAMTLLTISGMGLLCYAWKRRRQPSS